MRTSHAGSGTWNGAYSDDATVVWPLEWFPFFGRRATERRRAAEEAARLRAAEQAARAARGFPLGVGLALPIVVGLVFTLLSTFAGGGLPSAIDARVPRGVHVVGPGESLSGIASRYGLSWRELHAVGSNARRYPDANRIPVGAKLQLPGGRGLLPSLGTPALDFALPSFSFSLSLPFSVETCRNGLVLVLDRERERWMGNVCGRVARGA